MEAKKPLAETVSIIYFKEIGEKLQHIISLYSITISELKVRMQSVLELMGEIGESLYDYILKKINFS